MALLRLEATAGAIEHHLATYGYPYVKERKIPDSLCCPIDWCASQGCGELISSASP